MTPDEPTAPRLLVVDDSNSARRLLQGVLFGLGASPESVRTAADSAEAQRLVAEWKPGVVLLDVELRREGDAPAPRRSRASVPAALLNGDELGRQLLRANPGLPIVLVTALDQEHPRIQQLRGRGAVEVLMKPVRASQVHEVLLRLGIRLPSPK